MGTKSGGALRAVTDNYLVRALILTAPVVIAFSGEKMIAFHATRTEQMGWAIYPVVWFIAVLWFLAYRLAYKYMYCVHDRRNDWKTGTEEGTSALLQNIVDYAESKNDATRSFVIAALGFYFTFLLSPMSPVEVPELEFPLTLIMLGLSLLLLLTSYWLQNGLNMYDQVAAPFYQIITAAHEVNKTLDKVTKEFEKEPERFDKLKEDWGHYSTVDDRIVDAILDRVTGNGGRR